MLRQPPSATRRSALAAAGAGAVVTAGCSAGSSGADGPGSTSSGAPDADEQLVARVLAAVSSAHSLIVSTRRVRPRLNDELAGWERLHRAHAKQLGGLVSAGPRRAVIHDDDAAALRAVRAAERALQDTLSGAAVEASSGDLAASFASMAAALAQRLAAS